MAKRAQRFPEEPLGPQLLSRQDAAILAEELDARADTLELAALSGTRLPSYKGGIQQLGERVRLLRREAARLRGSPTTNPTGATR